MELVSVRDIMKTKSVVRPPSQQQLFSSPRTIRRPPSEHLQCPFVRLAHRRLAKLGRVDRLTAMETFRTFGEAPSEESP